MVVKYIWLFINIYMAIEIHMAIQSFFAAIHKYIWLFRYKDDYSAIHIWRVLGVKILNVYLDEITVEFLLLPRAILDILQK